MEKQLDTKGVLDKVLGQLKKNHKFYDYLNGIVTEINNQKDEEIKASLYSTVISVLTERIQLTLALKLIVLQLELHHNYNIVEGNRIQTQAGIMDMMLKDNKNTETKSRPDYVG